MFLLFWLPLNFGSVINKLCFPACQKLCCLEAVYVLHSDVAELSTLSLWHSMCADANSRVEWQLPQCDGWWTRDAGSLMFLWWPLLAHWELQTPVNGLCWDKTLANGCHRPALLCMWDWLAKYAIHPFIKNGRSCWFGDVLPFLPSIQPFLPTWVCFWLSPTKILCLTFGLLSASFTSSELASVSGSSLSVVFTSLIGSEISVASLSSFITLFTGIWDRSHGPKAYPSLCLIKVIPSSSLIPAPFHQSLSLSSLSISCLSSWGNKEDQSKLIEQHYQPSVSVHKLPQRMQKENPFSWELMPTAVSHHLPAWVLHMRSELVFHRHLEISEWSGTSDRGLRCCPALSSPPALLTEERGVWAATTH